MVSWCRVWGCGDGDSRPGLSPSWPAVPAPQKSGRQQTAIWGDHSHWQFSSCFLFCNAGVCVSLPHEPWFQVWWQLAATNTVCKGKQKIQQGNYAVNHKEIAYVYFFLSMEGTIPWRQHCLWKTCGNFHYVFNLFHTNLLFPCIYGDLNMSNRRRIFVGYKGKFTFQTNPLWRSWGFATVYDKCLKIICCRLIWVLTTSPVSWNRRLRLPSPSQSFYLCTECSPTLAGMDPDQTTAKKHGPSLYLFSAEPGTVNLHAQYTWETSGHFFLSRAFYVLGLNWIHSFWGGSVRGDSITDGN